LWVICAGLPGWSGPSFRSGVELNGSACPQADNRTAAKAIRERAMRMHIVG